MFSKVESSPRSSMAAGSDGASRRLRALVQPVDLLRRVHRSADHLNGRSYLLLGRQPLPCRHCLAQSRTVSLNTGSIVQHRRPCGIDKDFVGQVLFLYFIASRALGSSEGVTSVDFRFRSL